MISYDVKKYLERLLQEVGAKKVLTSARDANVAKPSEWASVTFPEEDRYEHRNEKFTYTDSETERTWTKRKAIVTATVLVKITAATPERSQQLADEFLAQVPRYIPDSQGFAIKLSLDQSVTQDEDNEVADKNLVQIGLIAVGGVWIRKVVPLIQQVVPEGKFVKQGELDDE